MADNAGFAVAITIRENLINNALLLAYAGTGFPRSLSLAVPDGPPDATVDMYLAPAVVSCRDDNTLGLAMQFWGPLRITADGGDQEHTIAGTIEVQVVPKFNVNGTNLVLAPDPDDVTITDWSFRVIDGGAYPPDVDVYLRGGLFRNRLLTAVRLALAAGLVPSIDLTFIGAIVDVVQTVAAARARAGVLLIGLSVQTNTVTIDGDPDLLFDIARGNDIAAATNPVAVPLILSDAAAKVAAEVASAGATLDRPLALTALPGKFHIAGSASNDDGTATFSFTLTPTFTHITPGALFTYLPKTRHVNRRVFPALDFQIGDVNVSLTESVTIIVYQVIAGILAGAVGLLMAYEIIETLKPAFGREIANADTGPFIARIRRTPPDKKSGAVIRVEITSYDISPDGVYTGLTVRPEVPPGVLIGPLTIPSDLRGDELRYTVRLPIDAHADDPQLRIRWSVFDPTTAHLLVDSDGVALGRTSFDFVPQGIGPGLTAYAVACRVYRVLGDQITEVLDDGFTLTVGDPLPKPAFGRWRYSVRNPQIVYDAETDSWKYAGENELQRHSNLHRIDPAHACRFANKVARYLASYDELDQLPFPVRSIELHRDQLCDYCFYGGPAGLRAKL